MHLACVVEFKVIIGDIFFQRQSLNRFDHLASGGYSRADSNILLHHDTVPSGNLIFMRGRSGISKKAPATVTRVICPLAVSLGYTGVDVRPRRVNRS